MGRLNKAVPFRHGCGSWAGCPSYNLSVTFGDSSPCRGASGEEARLSGMPKPPLDRGGGIAQAMTERLSPQPPTQANTSITKQ